MPTLRRLALATLLLTCVPLASHARCQGAVMLARLHDAYRALLVDSGHVQTNAAAALLVVIGAKDATALSRQVAQSGESIDPDRLRDTMEDAAGLAEQFMTARQLPDDRFRHSQNVEWLGDIVNRTDCRDSFTAIGTSFQSTSYDQPVQRQRVPRKTKQDQFLEFLAWLFGASAVVGAVGYGIDKFRNSHRYRTQMLERMPRHPVSIELELTYTSPSGDMHQTKVSALDVSAGGLKLDWKDNNAPPGTIVTVALPDGQKLATVMWSNAYYAGVMFDTMLSRKQLAALSENTGQEK